MLGRAPIRAGGILVVWAFWLASPAALSEDTFTPYASETIEHNTNIFDLPSNGPAPLGNSGPTFGDTYFRTRAGIEGTYLLDQQKFFGTAEFSRFDYDNFSLLDHNENLIDGGLNWTWTDWLKGTLEYQHAQRMVQFLDLQASTQLIIETENIATAGFNVDVTPEWRVESRFKDHSLDSPRLDVPGLSLLEDSIHEGLKYLGVSNLSAGVEAEYLQGSYEHDPSALDPKYYQTSLSAAATYIVSGFTNFSGNIGYSRRTDPTNGDLSGLTGRLSYQHSLSGKTTINVQLNRALNSYITTQGNELDTSASVTLNWQATYRLAAVAGYSYTDSKFPETPLNDTLIERIDHIQTMNVELHYQVLRWLQIHPYLRYQTRNSNDTIYSFNGTVVGVELLARRTGPK